VTVVTDKGLSGLLFLLVNRILYSDWFGAGALPLLKPCHGIQCESSYWLYLYCGISL